MTLSIVVVSWNVRDLLEACLASIRRYVKISSSEFEVLVVDNDSSDGSAEMVAEQFPEVRLIANRENFGFGRANNQAFAICRGQFVFLLNPDTELREGAVARLLQIMEQTPDAGIVGARLENNDGSFQRSSGGALPTLSNVAWHYLFLHQILPTSWGPLPTFLVEEPRGTCDIGWVSGAALMLRREAVGEKIFDERYFMYGEDLELCDRMHRSGWRVLYASEATVLHHLRQSLSKQTSAEMLATAVTGNRAYFRVRHGRLKTWLHDCLLTIGYTVRWLCFAVLRVIRNADDDAAKLETSRRYAVVSFRAFLRGGR